MSTPLTPTLFNSSGFTAATSGNVTLSDPSQVQRDWRPVYNPDATGQGFQFRTRRGRSLDQIADVTIGLRGGGCPPRSAPHPLATSLRRGTRRTADTRTRAAAPLPQAESLPPEVQDAVRSPAPVGSLGGRSLPGRPTTSPLRKVRRQQSSQPSSFPLHTPQGTGPSPSEAAVTVKDPRDVPGAR